MTTFAALHRPGDPFVLPNAWDVGSARALADAGFLAVGTTSFGIAASHGLPDATGAARDATLDTVRSLVTARLPCFLTADLEDGFSSDPEAVAELVAGLGVAGVNLEDATAGSLVDPAVHARRITAVKQRCPEVQLGEAGAARVSTGSMPYRVALTRAVEAAETIRDGGVAPAAWGYERVQALHSP